MKGKIVVFMAVCVCILMLLAGQRLGVEYDEALYVNSAVGCSNTGMFDTFVKTKAGHCFPVMVSVYLGALPSYIYRLVFTFLGVSVFTLRVVPILFYVVVLILIYRLVKGMFGTSIALGTVALLVLDVSFSLDAFFKSVVLFPLLLRLFSVFVAIQLHKKGYPLKWFVFLGMSIGLALWTKLDAIFFYLPICLAILICFPHEVRSRWKGITLLCGGIALSALPALYFLYTFHTPVLHAIRSVSTTIHATWAAKISALVPFVASAQLSAMTGAKMPVIMTFIGCSLGAFFISMIVKSLRRQSKGYQVIVLSYLFFVVLYVLFPALEKSHHAMLMTPIPALLIAMWMRQQKRQIQVVVATLLVSISFWQYGIFLRQSMLTCGERAWSCGIRDLVPHVAAQGGVIVYDWGIATQLQLYSKNTIHINEIAFKQSEELDLEIRRGIATCMPFIGQIPSYFSETSDRVEQALLQSERYTKRTIVRDGNIYEIWTCTSLAK